MAEGDQLPTISEAISNWLGVQIPGLPQTLKNTDKAVGKLILALGENLEARMRSNTGKVKAQGKIDVEGMYRTEEEKRKLENRAAVTQAALEEMEADTQKVDAKSEIEDDWLNLFARLSEDKSSEELQRLFGRILAGEIRKPGSFSLRTIQLMATISKRDAELVSRFLSYAINREIVPYQKDEKAFPAPRVRILMEELGVAGHPTQIGGMSMTYTVVPRTQYLSVASGRGYVVDNKTDESVQFSIPGQMLTGPGKELFEIAHPPLTDLEFLREVATAIHNDLKRRYPQHIEAGLILVRFGSATPIDNEQFLFSNLQTIGS
jgi:Protein of unknown function (DUF2806)